MFSHNKSKNRLMIRSSPDIHAERTNSKSRKKKNSLAHEFDILFNKIDNIREWTKSLIKDSIALVSTESNMDIKSYLNDSEKKHLGKTKLEHLGMDMIHAAKSSGVRGGIHERALLLVGECERRLGTYARDFVVDVCSSFIRPLKYFMEVELNKLLEEKEMLTCRKNDYDYHVRQTSNGRADKNTHHKLKMAEMALEFQFVHAKDILQGIELSECQVGHLSDLVSIQAVYHQKCLAELEKLKIDLQRMSNNVSRERTKEKSVKVTVTKISSSSKLKKRDETNITEMRPSCLKRLESQVVPSEESKTPDSRISQERLQKANRTNPEKSIGSDEGDEGVQEKHSVPGGSKIRTSPTKISEYQTGNARDEAKCPQKARSSILRSVERRRTRLERIPEDSKSKPNFESSQDCGKHQSNHHSPLKVCHKLPPPAKPSCYHYYSGDHSSGNSANEDDNYTSDDSTTSKETHVIPIPIRSNYRRDVGKMFFTPCKDME